MADFSQDIDLSSYHLRLDRVSTLARVIGRVREVTGLVVHATVSGVTVGEIVSIGGRAGEIPAQVIGFKDDRVVLMPMGDLNGVGPNSPVSPRNQPHAFPCGPSILGRVLNGLGEPIDGRGPVLEPHWPVERAAPVALERARITQPFVTGVRAIDGLITLGEGQRVGLFAGSGVGKSTLLGQIAREADADVVVIALVGERGRELRAFIEDTLGSDGLSRAVVVCSTSDEPSLMRRGAALVATAVAEFFRDQGARVLLMLDSITRFARAQREIGLAAGEPPVRRGFPPSVFRLLPKLLERAGNNHIGSITAIYTVLVEADDLNEPIADEVRAILDGHIILNRSIAELSRWPAIDITASVSRVMHQITSTEHQVAADMFRLQLAAFEANRTLINAGAYKMGADPDIDLAIHNFEHIDEFLQQDILESSHFAFTINSLLDQFGA